MRQEGSFEREDMAAYADEEDAGNESAVPKNDDPYETRTEVVVANTNNASFKTQ